MADRRPGTVVVRMVADRTVGTDTAGSREDREADSHMAEDTDDNADHSGCMGREVAARCTVAYHTASCNRADMELQVVVAGEHRQRMVVAVVAVADIREPVGGVDGRALGPWALGVVHYWTTPARWYAQERSR